MKWDILASVRQNWSSMMAWHPGAKEQLSCGREGKVLTEDTTFRPSWPLAKAACPKSFRYWVSSLFLWGPDGAYHTSVPTDTGSATGTQGDPGCGLTLLHVHMKLSPQLPARSLYWASWFPRAPPPSQNGNNVNSRIRGADSQYRNMWNSCNWAFFMRYFSGVA